MMSLKRFVFFGLMLFSFLGCSGYSCPKSSSLPSEVALCYAASDGLNTEEIVVSSLSKHQNGEMSAIDTLRSDNYAKSLRRSLQGKRYYEVCLRPREGGLGGEVCYFLEIETKKKISTHRGM